jgi:hypothetical protein
VMAMRRELRPMKRTISAGVEATGLLYQNRRLAYRRA